MTSAIEQKTERLGSLLSRQGLKLATAESCTGGWIAQQATTRAGSSAWFDCGFVTYSNEAKVAMLGVSPETLAQHGAVSEAVVVEMVQGALANSGAQLAVATSGIAGPDGGSAEKPVGTVWVAWGFEEKLPQAHCFHFPGDREAVRYSALEQALAGLIRLLEENFAAPLA